MAFLFLFARIYPYMGIAIAFLSLELGWYFRRKESKSQYVLFGMGFFFLITSGLWVYFRGDMHSDQWVKALLTAF